MGWPVVWKCFVTCLFLELSQQPTWPQLIHSLKWDPGISHLQTLLAALGTGCDVSYLVQMRTWCGHRSSPLGNTSADRGDSVVVNELSGTHQSPHNNVRREHDGRLCRSDRVLTALERLWRCRHRYANRWRRRHIAGRSPRILHCACPKTKGAYVATPSGQSVPAGVAATD
jgi:hypothetical protein